MIPAQVSEDHHRVGGWCPHTPVIRTAPVILSTPPPVINRGGQDGGGGSARIRLGIRIATESIKTLFRERHLLWFSILAGLVMLFLIAAEAWIISVIIADSETILPFLTSIPIGDSFLAFDTRSFILQLVCLTCFNLLLAGLVLFRSRGNTGTFLTTRDASLIIRPHAGAIAALSIGMAVAGTFIGMIISQTQFIGKIVFSIDMAVFYLPYAYYVPDLLGAALDSSAIIIAITIIQFLLALYVVPVIVLENKRLLPALAGSVILMKKTWRELLGCILVLGAIVLGVAAIALVIGQSPLLLNHDYDFFLQITRGQVLMTVACYGFLLTCGMLTTLGFTALGVAITDLYTSGKTRVIHQQQEIIRTIAGGRAR